MARLKLTADNYYSQEANWEYMSSSQFKAFEKCPAAAMAELRGEWHRPSSQALLVGGYVDAYFSHEMEQYRADHPEIFKRDGTLKSEFVQAEAICKRLERDELALMLISGKNQVIKTGRIGGIWFKGKFDSLLSARQVEAICKKFPAVRELVPLGGPMIVDLKCMANLDDKWDPEEGQYVNFIRAWGYDFQGAIYQALDKRSAPFVIVAATKEAEPRVDAQYIPDNDLRACLDYVASRVPLYAEIKAGKKEPDRCGNCPYCRATARLTSIRHY